MKEETRETQMLSTCVNCEFYETKNCRHFYEDKNEYTDSCRYFVTDSRFGFGKTLGEDGNPLMDVASPRYKDYEDYAYFNNLVAGYGFLGAIRKLRSDSDKLAMLTCSSKLGR